MSLNKLLRATNYSLNNSIDNGSSGLLESFPTPQSGQQKLFYESEADIVIYGGAAGSGKSFACLIDAAKYVGKIKGYNALILRRTYPELSDVGAMIDTSKELYSLLGGEFLESKLKWKFNDSEIRFGHLQYDKDLHRRQGSQIPRLYFDELTTFTERQFWYLLSRCRTGLPITPKVRATCNPDSTSWVRTLLDSGGYINDEGFPINGGTVRWFVRINSELIWGDSLDEINKKYPDVPPKSFTFIPAKIHDNPILLKNDPSYLANLHAQHPVDRARLLDGNWNANYEQGKVFNPIWFKILSFNDIKKYPGITIRFWDLAASTNSKSYYTAGVKIRKVTNQNLYIVLDIKYHKFEPVNVPKFLAATAKEDGENVHVFWEQEPGSSGKLANSIISQNLAATGLKLRGGAIPPISDKLTRAIPFAVSAEQGQVYLLQSDWNNIYINNLQKFDGSAKPLVNDLTDASTGAFNLLKKQNTIKKGNIIY